MAKTTDSKADKPGKISYWSKEKYHCPACNRDFNREEMFGGRVNAGDLTDELHRLTIPMAKYGEVFPLIYEIGACPNCHLALFWNDFKAIVDDKESLSVLRDDDLNRQDAVKKIFPHYDLKRERTLLDGAAMYYLALLCYEKVDLGYGPTIKRAMISVRLAWLCQTIHEKCPGRNYDFISQTFYRKALFFYEQSLANEQAGTEALPKIKYGPDFDFDYGYTGIIYMKAILEYKYGQKEDMNLRFKKFGESKRSIARIFGIGKSSKEKPGPLLTHARDLYDILNKELKDANSIEAYDDEDEEE